MYQETTLTTATYDNPHINFPREAAVASDANTRTNRTYPCTRDAIERAYRVYFAKNFDYTIRYARQALIVNLEDTRRNVIFQINRRLLLIDFLSRSAVAGARRCISCFSRTAPRREAQRFCTRTSHRHYEIRPERREHVGTHVRTNIAQG